MAQLPMSAWMLQPQAGLLRGQTISRSKNHLFSKIVLTIKVDAGFARSSRSGFSHGKAGQAVFSGVYIP